MQPPPQALFWRKLAGKYRVILPFGFGIDELGENAIVTVAAVVKMRSESAMAIETCVTEFPVAYAEFKMLKEFGSVDVAI